MSNLSDLLPAGGGAKVITATASGNLATGQTVILQSDGTVKVVEQTTISEGKGSATTFESGSTAYTAAAYDTNKNKVLVAYKDSGDSGQGKAVVGTVSGTSITFNSPMTFRNSSGVTGTNYIAVAFDSTRNNFAVVWMANYLNRLQGKILTIQDDGTVNDGSFTTIVGNQVSYIAIAYSPTQDKFLVSYRDHNSSNYGRNLSLTSNGNTFSVGTPNTFTSNTVEFIDNVYGNTTDDRFVVGYKRSATPYVMSCYISGTQIVNQAEYQLASANGDQTMVGYDAAADRYVAVYRDEADSDKAALKSFAVTTSASAGASTITAVSSEVHANSSSSTDYDLAYDSSVQKLSLFYVEGTKTYVRKITDSTESGLAVGAAFELTPATNPRQSSAVYDPDSKNFVYSYSATSSSDIGRGIVYQPTYAVTNSDNFVGITNQAINNSASGEVVVKGGVITNASLGLTLTPGTTYYVQDDGSLNTATSAVNYDIANGSYTQAFSVSSQDTFPSGVAFNPAGTKMFVVGNTGDDVNEYTLSTGFDVSTASFVDSFSVSGQQAAPMSVAFNTDGTKMYIVGETEDTVAQYALSAGFDVSSASYTQAFDISGQETEAQGITFNTDGTKMFIVGDTGNDINEYTLSTGFDVSSASFVDSFSLASQTTQPKEGVFNTDGTELYVLARDNQKVYKYTLTTGFDVSSASYASVEFSVSSQETSPQGLAFSADGSKMYVCGDTGDDVNQYATTSTATNSTTVTAGKALAATTLLLKG